MEVPFDSVRSPQAIQHTSGRSGLPALIEGTIPLPGLAQLRSKSYLAQLYAGRNLSARLIGWLTEVSQPVVLAALSRCAIPKNVRKRTYPGSCTSRTSGGNGSIMSVASSRL